jgi:hypothetical protein
VCYYPVIIVVVVVAMILLSELKYCYYYCCCCYYINWLYNCQYRKPPLDTILNNFYITILKISQSSVLEMEI